MSLFLVRHLLESTFVYLLLSAVACCIRRGATARYAVLLLAVAKFAIPTVLLAQTGEQLAVLWPATSWVSILTYKFSTLFAEFQGLFTSGRQMTMAVAWGVGTAVLFILWIRRLRADRIALLAPGEQEEVILRTLQARLRMRQKVQLRCTTAECEPALHGVCRPTITIPQGLVQRLSRVEFEGVLLHELAHARRLDNLTSVFVHALVCLFWFHPLLWIVERWLIVERERACDEAVLGSGIDPGEYAAALLKVCQFHIAPITSGVSGVNGGDLRERFERILSQPVAGGLLYVPWLLMTFLIILMTLVPVAGGYCGQCAQTIGDGGMTRQCVGAINCAQTEKGNQ